MCEALRELMKEEIEEELKKNRDKAIQEGLAQGLAQGCVAYNKSTRYRRQNSPVSEREFLKIGKGHVEAK